MKVTIVGTGLLGTSLGLALRRVGGWQVVGFDSDADSAGRALARGALDRKSESLEDACKDATHIVVAVPVGATVETVRGLPAPEAAVITDVASVKGPIVAALGAESFVGSHPLAGGEQSGPDAARADLFDGVTCVITPRPSTPAETVRQVEQLWEAAGGKPIQLDAGKHDEVLALTSHVPHLAAFALAASAGDLANDLVAPSLREMTRVAESNPTLWADILIANPAVMGALDRLMGSLEELRDALRSSDRGRLESALTRARDARMRLR